jgi:chorismate mutase
MVKAVRGAVQIESDEKGLVASAVKKMIEEIVLVNGINIPDIVSIFFTLTSDIKSVNPAAALRTGVGFEHTALFCAQEPDTEGALPMIVRVLVTCNNFKAEQDVRHVYSGGAEALRPDLN